MVPLPLWMSVGPTAGLGDSLNVLQICSAHLFKALSQPGAFALFHSPSLSVLLQMFSPPTDESAIIDGFI